MKLLMLFLVAGVLHAETSVDRVVTELDFLSNGTLDGWTYSTDFRTVPFAPGFHDAGWDTLRIGQSIYVDSCWLRKEVVIPERMLGEKVHGALRFHITVDDYGYLWINGESKGRFDWDGEFDLTSEAVPGQHLTLIIKAMNTGGPLRLLRANIVSETSAPLRNLIDNITLSLRTGQKLLSFDTYQTNARVTVDPHIDKSAFTHEQKAALSNQLEGAAAAIDVAALRTGDLARFRASIENARVMMRPVGDYAKHFTLYFDANAHIDAAWLWRKAETIEVCKNTFSSVMNMMEQRPDFTYTQSAAAYYDWMERYYPDLFGKIRQRVKEGRWEVVGGMWVEPDCNLPSGESWARHLLYAKGYFRNKLGVDVTLGWNPDSFGYNENMPMFYRNAGINAFITQKIGWNDTDVFPYRLFWWESPDGSRILSYFPFDYVNTVDDPFRLVDWLRQHEANTGIRKMLVLFGVGDHGGGPSLEMLDRIDRLKTIDIYPSIEYGTATQYLDWLSTRDLSHVPVWKDELYLEYHRGTYTTQANMKHLNRTSEVLLTNAEKFSAIATLAGGTYAAGDLEEAWRNVLFNQFHDILPGSGIRENYIDATESYHASDQIGTHVLNDALAQIASHINTSSLKHGRPIAVFNALGWSRTDLVSLDLPEGDLGEYRVFDGKGNSIPTQRVLSGKYRQTVLFIASDIPATGYAMYELRKGASPKGPATLIPATTSLENGLFRLTIDADSGWVKSIVDKRTGKALLASDGNKLQLLEDLPRQWDAWNIGLTGKEFPSTFRKAELMEIGPVRCTIRLTRDYLKPGTVKDFPTEDFPSSFFTQDISLYDGLDRIDFTTDVDWWEDRTMLKVAFPLSFTDSAATYEVPYGTIRRSTGNSTSYEKAQFEVPAERWADVSSAGYGVSLLNMDKYGYDIKGNLMRLSLLRSPKWPDPTADRGKHTIRYALYPHTGDWREGGTVQRGYEFNNPLIARFTSTHRGSLPLSYSFVRLNPRSLVLTSIKKAEDSDAWVIQWYNPGNRDMEASLNVPRAIERVVLSNFLEKDDSLLTPTSLRLITTKTPAHGVTTMKVYFPKAIPFYGDGWLGELLPVQRSEWKDIDTSFITDHGVTWERGKLKQHIVPGGPTLYFYVHLAKDDSISVSYTDESGHSGEAVKLFVTKGDYRYEVTAYLPRGMYVNTCVLGRTIWRRTVLFL